MKILHIIPSYKPAYVYGGPVICISALAEAQAELGHDVTVYTTTANGKGELDVVPGKRTDVDGVHVYYFKKFLPDQAIVSPSLWRRLQVTINDFDAIHIHSWWNPLVLGAVWVCRKKKVTPILSPHGMFSRYVIEARNPVKKTIIHRLIGKRLLEHTFLHVSTQMEWHESKQIICKWKGNIISNLVQLPGKLIRRTENEIFTIGFLSRIDPVKGLDKLIAALGKTAFSYRLLVAGTGEEQYINVLKTLADSCGNGTNIEWVGWKSGPAKYEFLSQLDLVALTSNTENFALVIIESLAVGTPVLVSDQVGLCDYVNRSEFGWVCGLEIDQITKTLNSIHGDKKKLKKIRGTAPATIKRDYDKLDLGNQYIEYYKSVFTGL